LALVPNIGIAATTVQFKSNAAEALQGLAEIGGNVEWGVRADKEFYFVPRTSLVRQQYVVGDNISLFQTNTSADDVVNRVYLTGANGLFAVLSNGAYMAGSQKERIIVAPFIGSSADASLWGTAYFFKYGTAQPRGQLAVGATDAWIEGVGHPLGLLRVLGGPQFIERGEPLPDQLPMQLGEVMGAITDQRFRINAVSYLPAEGNLNVVIELGERGSAVADYLRTIELRLSELRQLL
jgi:hypothetical protein